MARFTINENGKAVINNLEVKEEQPYTLPDNWVWTLFGTTCEVRNGYAFKSKDYCEDGIRVFRISDIGKLDVDNKNNVMVPKEQFNERFLINKGDFLIAMSGATTGKSGIYNSENIAMQNQRVGNVKVKYNKIVNDKFKNLFMINSGSEILDKAYGAAQPNISSSLIESLKFPLPPLSEQQRIVNYIESLFEKIDKAQELIEEAREGFEKRKEAILAKAFRGELTAKWREENGKSVDQLLGIDLLFQYPASWEFKKLSEISEIKSGYAFKSNEFVDEGIQVIRMGNLYDSKLDLNRNPVYLPRSFDERIVERYSVKSGDLLLTLTGTKYKRDYGYAIKIETDERLLINQRIMSIESKIGNDYVLHYLRSNQFRDDFFANETGGVNQGNVSSKYVSTVVIPVPPADERVEICRILNKLLKENEESMQLCDSNNHIDILKKSILAKAFRAELGTNIAEEESAIELLKNIQSMKVGE